MLTLYARDAQSGTVDVQRRVYTRKQILTGDFKRGPTFEIEAQSTTHPPVGSQDAGTNI
jgi:hypothetical protein